MTERTVKSPARKPQRVRLSHTVQSGIGLGFGIALAQLIIFTVAAAALILVLRMNNLSVPTPGVDPMQQGMMADPCAEITEPAELEQCFAENPLP